VGRAPSQPTDRATPLTTMAGRSTRSFPLTSNRSGIESGRTSVSKCSPTISSTLRCRIGGNTADLLTRASSSEKRGPQMPPAALRALPPPQSTYENDPVSLAGHRGRPHTSSRYQRAREGYGPTGGPSRTFQVQTREICHLRKLV